jgi:hypothetical protein
MDHHKSLPENFRVGGASMAKSESQATNQALVFV